MSTVDFQDSLPSAALTVRSWLLKESDETLRAELRRYRFEGRFTGGYFELIASGSTDPNRFDPVDIVSLWALSIDPTAKMIHQIVGELNNDIEPLLRAWPDEELAGLSIERLHQLDTGDMGLDKVWDILAGVPQIGPTTASKLIAKKRPHLVPIYDSVIKRALGISGSGDHWLVMHALLNLDGGTLQQRLVKLSETDEGRGLSPLRVFDILVWKHYREPGETGNEASTATEAV